MVTMTETLANVIRSWVISAVGGTPKVFFDYPNDQVTSLPRYVIIGPVSDDYNTFIGTKIDLTQTGSTHDLDYDIEVWSKSNKEAAQQMDKIEEYILKNISSFGTNQISNVQVTSQNQIFLDEQRIHRRVLSIRISYVKQR